MSEIRVLIVDDEPLARDTIRLLLESDAEITVLGECADGGEAVQAIRDQKPDLVFLDIQMPVLNGFEVIEEVGTDAMPVTVFATAFDEYALRAFDSAALDYLLKPYDDERFERAVERAKTAVAMRKKSDLRDQFDTLIAKLADRQNQDVGPVERILVKDRETVRFVDTRDIQWIEAAGDYVSIRAADRSHLLRDTMSSMEKKLDPTRFVRIHRSTIVNLDFVKEMKSYFHGDYIVYLKSGKELRLSRRYWDKVQAAIESSGDA